MGFSLFPPSYFYFHPSFTSYKICFFFCSFLFIAFCFTLFLFHLCLSFHLSSFFFLFSLTIPLPFRPPLLHLFPFLLILSGRGTLNVGVKMVCRPRCWKKTTDRRQQSTGHVIQTDSEWHGLKNSSRTPNLVSLTAWSVEILVKGERALTQTETQSLTAWQINRETERQPDRQFARKAALVSHSRFSLSLSPNSCCYSSGQKLPPSVFCPNRDYESAV